MRRESEQVGAFLQIILKALFNISDALKILLNKKNLNAHFSVRLAQMGNERFEVK